MDTTIFLAQLWGPTILAVGIGVFVSRKYYVKIYRDLEKDALAVLIFGMVGMAAGIAHILAHNSWNTFFEGLISFLGWGLLIKAAMFTIVPDFVAKAGDWWVSNKRVPIAGALSVIAGLYICWMAFF